MGWSDFTKIKKIGEGSFGAAWLVRGNKDGISYVIKIISVSKMPTREREEARKEVSVLAQMKHPNIVSYIDSFEESGNLCIVMDYCDGGDLYSKIHSTKGLVHSEEQIIDWFVQITLALKHVHDRKILHRDLKSQNIFLTKDGTVKLGDFGVAKVLTNTMDFARTAIGTPYYMSPELVEHKPYNNKSDVWSLGCVLYELVSMKHPFTANNMEMLAYKISKGNYEPVNGKFSYDLRNLISTMLKRDPRERPSVNGILRKSFIMKKCERFLTNEKLREEFSHTVLHGENFAKKIQNMDLRPKMSPTPRPSSAAGQKPNLVMVGQSAAVCASPGRAVYDPAKIYGAPVVRRSDQQLRQSIEKRNAAYRIKQSEDNKPSLADPEHPIVVRKASYLEQLKIRKQREEEALKKAQKDLIEKQKQERIKRASVDGWKNVLNSQSSSDENKPKILSKPKNDIYSRHLQALKNRRSPITPRPHNNYNLPAQKKQPIIKSPINDFKQRKEEFLRNKIRGQGGAVNHPLAGRHPIVAPKRDEKSDYEERLHKIRQQNFNRRKEVNNARIESFKQIELAREERLKKLENLKRQSEEQRLKLKREIEADKLEVKKLSDFTPASPVRMTEVFNAIGVNKIKPLVNNQEFNNQRKSWSKATDLDVLENKTLVQQTMYEKTLEKKEEIILPRKAWDLPHETIIKAFELADLSPQTTHYNSSLDETKRSNLKRADTFVIKKQDELKSVLNNIEKSEPSGILDISPEKLATLKATKSILLGVTLGQYDSKSIKLLRTCSEPDMSTLALDEKKSDDAWKTPVSAINTIMTLKSTLKRLSRSVEDVNKNEITKVSEDGEEEEEDSPSIDNNESTTTNTNDESEDNGDLEEICNLMNKSTINEKKKSKVNEIETDFADVSEVANTMASLLNEDSCDESFELKKKRESPTKRCVKFVSQSRLVSAVSVSIDPVDSLEISRKNSSGSENNDERDCECVELNGENGDPDTEFEDDIVIISVEAKKISFCTAEENRMNLEKKLGTVEFIKAYPVIEKQVMNEQKKGKARPSQDCKSFVLFKKLFPLADFYLFQQFYDLILNDNDNE